MIATSERRNTDGEDVRCEVINDPCGGWSIWSWNSYDVQEPLVETPSLKNRPPEENAAVEDFFEY